MLNFFILRSYIDVKFLNELEISLSNTLKRDKANI